MCVTQLLPERSVTCFLEKLPCLQKQDEDVQSELHSIMSFY